MEKGKVNDVKQDVKEDVKVLLHALAVFIQADMGWYLSEYPSVLRRI